MQWEISVKVDWLENLKFRNVEIAGSSTFLVKYKHL